MRKNCIVYGGHNQVPNDMSDLCIECFNYLHSGIGDHPTLMRPKWELVPRLRAIADGLRSDHPYIRNTALRSLNSTVEVLDQQYPHREDLPPLDLTSSTHGQRHT